MDFSYKQFDDGVDRTKKDKKMELITRNIQEIINLDFIRDKITSNKTIKIYWGITPATTLHPLFCFLLPLLKIRDFIQANWSVIIFLADIHSYLDEGIEAYSNVEQRTKLYELIVTKILKSLGVKRNKYKIVKGSDMQLSNGYTLDLLKFSTIVSVNSARNVVLNVVKPQENEDNVSSLIYPLMQILDQEALGADVQLGGVEQKKIFELAVNSSDKMGMAAKTYFIYPSIPRLNNTSELMFFDSNHCIKKKISQSFCEEKVSDVSKNFPLAVLKFIIFPMYETVVIQRPDKRGGTIKYDSFKELEQDWIDGKIFAVDIKNNLVNFIIKILAPIRSEIIENENFIL